VVGHDCLAPGVYNRVCSPIMPHQNLNWLFFLTIFSCQMYPNEKTTRPTLPLQSLHLSVTRTTLLLHYFNTQCHESWWTWLLLTLFQFTVQLVFISRTFLTWFSFMYNNLQLRGKQEGKAKNSNRSKSLENYGGTTNTSKLAC
jgi:hypothetical protein